LPDISLPDSSDMRLYPEKPVYTNRTDGEWVIGTRQLSVAYVPSATGMQTIPAIRLDWWDSTEEKQKTAELPAWTVNVLPGDGLADPAPPPPITPTVVDPGQLVDASAVQAAGTGSRDWLALAKSHWPWLPGAILLVTALLFGLRHHNSRNVPTSAHPAAKRGKQQIRIARTAVQRACEDNNPAAAARALLQWAAASWPDDPPRNLGALMRHLSTGVNELQMLESIWADATQGKADISDARARLKAVNEELWDIEDRIRVCESRKAFGDEFLELARAVYVTNDKRADIKKEINLELGSELVEEKSYEDYS